MRPPPPARGGGQAGWRRPSLVGLVRGSGHGRASRRAGFPRGTPREPPRLARPPRPAARHRQRRHARTGDRRRLPQPRPPPMTTGRATGPPSRRSGARPAAAERGRRPDRVEAARQGGEEDLRPASRRSPTSGGRRSWASPTTSGARATTACAPPARPRRPGLAGGAAPGAAPSGARAAAARSPPDPSARRRWVDGCRQVTDLISHAVPWLGWASPEGVEIFLSPGTPDADLGANVRSARAASRVVAPDHPEWDSAHAGALDRRSRPRMETRRLTTAGVERPTRSGRALSVTRTLRGGAISAAPWKPRARGRWGVLDPSPWPSSQAHARRALGRPCARAVARCG
jgi:hypothetical protein